MTDHTLTIDTHNNTDVIVARCDCHQWSMFAPDIATALKLHRCHTIDTTPNTTRPARHGGNHPTLRRRGTGPPPDR